MQKWILAVLPLLVGSCDDHLYGSSASGCRDEHPLTWENFGWGIMDDACNGCHSSLHSGEDRSGAPEGVDFETWDGVLEWAERIHIRSIETETMPPSGGLGPLERAMLEEWLLCEVFPAAGVN